MSDPGLYHLPDGRHICQVCMEVKTRDELEPVSGSANVVWDVCRACAAQERAALADHHRQWAAGEFTHKGEDGEA